MAQCNQSSARRRKVILPALSGGLQTPLEGTPAAAIWSWGPDTQSHRPALTPCKGPSSIIVEARSSFCSLVQQSEKTGRLFSTGWISALKENKRGQIQSQTVNTPTENRREEWRQGGEEALGNFDYVQIMPERLGPREKAVPERVNEYPGRPASRVFCY